MKQYAYDLPARIAALTPRTPGHRFVIYSDACSGVPEAPHEQTFAAVNAVVRRLDPQPEFIVFPGDEIVGLTADPDRLRAQWRHWLEKEMGWLDQTKVPLWQTTGNHTTYDAMSEGVFTEVLSHLPRNGPAGQEGLSYWVRRGDLFLVFVNTLWSGLGGEGHVETVWLKGVLSENADARHKLVIGHHPVHPVNGFSGAYQREIGPEYAGPFWDVLVTEGVLAYICSHILAYDAQVHCGVLQLCTAGAGTAHRMPEGVEYLHCVQAALDAEGLRCQVLDTAGQVRERLSWPICLPPAAIWEKLPAGSQPARVAPGSVAGRIAAFRFAGSTASSGHCAPQTLFSAHQSGGMSRLWIGLRGPEQVLTVMLAPETGRSPHYWLGPSLAPGVRFDLQLLVHAGMGPGGIMLRAGEDRPWSSLAAASPWGAERLIWPGFWAIGCGPAGTEDRPFLGADLVSSLAMVEQ